MPTKIEWTDETWNPVTGCGKVSQGCKHCYALRGWPRLSSNPKTVYFGREFTDVACHPERLDQPLRWAKPRMIFVNSMSDLFHPDVPDEFIDKVFAVMALAPQHTFQVLTKRADRMRAYMTADGGFGRWGYIDGCARKIYSLQTDKQFPAGKVLIGPLPNVWLGVSVEDQVAADERIPLLLETPAAVRWISAEPVLGPVDLVPYMGGRTIKCGCGWRRDEHHLIGAIIGKEKCMVCGQRAQTFSSLDWVVAGGESGPNARPMHPDWARDLRDQCAAAGVPFLFKQHGEWAPENSIDNDGSPFADSFLRNAEIHVCDRGERLYRVGKKRAGRLLDGAQHDEYPKQGGI